MNLFAFLGKKYMKKCRKDRQCLNRHAKLDPRPIGKGRKVDEVIESAMFSFNAGSFRKACELFAEHVAKKNVRIGVSLAGALVPAGIGRSCLIPLIKAGLVDWIVSTGANLYHDLHYVLGYDFTREGRLLTMSS